MCLFSDGVKSEIFRGPSSWVLMRGYEDLLRMKVVCECECNSCKNFLLEKNACAIEKELIATHFVKTVQEEILILCDCVKN